MDTVVFLLEDFSSIAFVSAIDSLQPFMNVLPQPKSCGYVARILRQAYRTTSFNVSVFNITEQTIANKTDHKLWSLSELLLPWKIWNSSEQYNS